MILTRCAIKHVTLYHSRIVMPLAGANKWQGNPSDRFPRSDG
jgi:hypothetical protein